MQTWDQEMIIIWHFPNLVTMPNIILQRTIFRLHQAIIRLKQYRPWHPLINTHAKNKITNWWSKIYRENSNNRFVLYRETGHYLKKRACVSLSPRQWDYKKWQGILFWTNILQKRNKKAIIQKELWNKSNICCWLEQG